ncbi:hypothetical protein TPHA_0A04500 [Tetrapisispora phaffii CBS 4417]|uniref:Uncharacterized protein n=1 Tax=Tetrapisispora phaffii (strain ATCC 24235 / CBS 4417 / NBRC 1672 / NRRL Y-8282 / UCD 70-5) TaxID=1071381 RepID=G8BNP5_TETPH|nr:hypothetical protein TPHA_0A04500 [Tetrapisispora phaffii CBS 4417]CCE61523.1 hypothetical protein TPHA_0A04500 [Tetrapisispora phaffii CBS 4417]
MAKQKVTTKTTKRYRYSSFKAKIDDLKIEPARNLTKRAYDYVETSHLLASFDHWKEINLSANFAKFSDEIESNIQTLPQILFHQKDIINTLTKYIDMHDDNSLQPLLDMLAQLCHDLGPDFMPYYGQTVTSLINMLDEAINFEKTSVFEWGFNCLAYIFKYLSKLLSEDLIPTYTLLFPLLSHSKEYLSRFSAEAMSYLIRKSNSKNLSNFISFSLNQLKESEGKQLYDGLVTLYTESLTSIQESLHSKAKVIYSLLIENTLTDPENEESTALLCDIWLNISKFGSSENLIPLYNGVTDILDENLSVKTSNASIKLICVLSFSESGKKVPSWDVITKLVGKIISLGDASFLDQKALSFLFATLFRNCDIKSMTTFHKKIFDFYLTNNHEYFIEFFSCALDVSSEKVISFNGSRYLQKYVNNRWKENVTKLSLFLLQLEGTPDMNNKLNINLSDDFSDFALKNINELDVTSEQGLYDIFCNSILLRYSKKIDSEIIFNKLTELVNLKVINDFTKDVFGKLLFLTNTLKETQTCELLTKIFLHIEHFKNSGFFIAGFRHFIESLETKDSISAILKSFNDSILALITNLSLPDSKIRYETMILLSKLLELQGYETPNLLNECKIIEEIPLTLQNARDITVRIRKMGEVYQSVTTDDFVTKVFFNYLFGLLTIRFSPVWEGVFEILPNIYSVNQDLMWNLIKQILIAPDNEYQLKYYDTGMQDDSDIDAWTVRVTRFNDLLVRLSNIWLKFNFSDASIIDISKERRGNLIFPIPIRSQALKVMSLMPSLVERHSKDVVPFLLNDGSSVEKIDEDEEQLTFMNASKWSDMDRNSLLKVFAKFKNPKSIFKSDEVHSRLMFLLSSGNNDVQKLALDAVFPFKEPISVKYRNLLKNLLDDTLFRDEISKFAATDNAKMVEDSDEETLMTYVLRIIFGRAQIANGSGVKKSRKNAVISILPTLKTQYIIDFFKLGSNRFDSEYYFLNGNNIIESEMSISTMKRMIGFVNIVKNSFSVLGSNFPSVIETLIHPLLYSIAASNYVISNSTEEVSELKIATQLRQQGMKCLDSVFQYMGETLNWDPYRNSIYEIVIKPRLPKFMDENLQQTSAIMNIITYWSTKKELYPFLCMDDFSATRALMNTLMNTKAKESVIMVLLEASNNIVVNPSEESSYIELVTLIASTCLKVLPELYNKLTNTDSVSVAIDLLLNITKAGYVQDNETRKYFVDSLTNILDSNLKRIRSNDVLKILKVVGNLIIDYDSLWEDIENLYKVIASFYRTFNEREHRLALNNIMTNIAHRFHDIQQTTELLIKLNSYSQRRILEYDFPTILSAYKQITDHRYKDLTENEWLPILYTSLYYINNNEELALRANATHLIKKFIDYINEKSNVENAAKSVAVLKSVMMVHIRSGLRKYDEEIQGEYISIVAYIVTNSVYYTDLEDMKVLLYNNDEEANFFNNIYSIQLHRRQRAIRRLKEYGDKLSSASISHYLIPIIEHYVFTKEEKYSSISQESLETIGALSNFINWNQYKALLRRYIAILKHKPDNLKESVLLINEVSVSIKNTLQSSRKVTESVMVLKNIPNNLSEIDSFVSNEIYPTLSKILGTRNTETIIERIPLSEALVNFVLGLETDSTSSLLPGILTSICQILRSKNDDLRDIVRKTLSKIAAIVGPEYLVFIIKELNSALQRGSQVHVLSYTVNYILKSMAQRLKHSDLDASARLLVNIIMEGIFGTTGQEKDSDNYHTNVKEVKSNKSYDTGEILSANISLPVFGTLIMPIRALLLERINLKSQNKLDELLRRYALGLNHNDDANSEEVLKLCYEMFEQSNVSTMRKKDNRSAEVQEKEDFFMVNLNSKTERVETGSTLYQDTMQKFSLDLLRTVLSKHTNLLNAVYVEGFIPLLKNTMVSEDESVLVSSFRVLILMVKLDLSEESEALFKNYARKILNIIKDSPSTSTELCQMGLKFLSSFIRHKDIELKNTALSYVLNRILPDLNEPSKQGLAFNFLKALIHKHIILPEIYDVIESVRKIVVTNHNKEIRDISRSVFYQFLMEYDQSKGRLEKQFKFMVDNLQYPTQEGRQSIMELINLIVMKANPALLAKISSSFFVALANVTFNDESPKCREMAANLLGNLLMKLDSESLKTIDKYLMAWLNQSQDINFLNLGMRIYKIYLSNLGLGKNEALDALVIAKIKSILSNTGAGSDLPWDIIYTAMSVYSIYIQKTDAVYEEDFSSTWENIISTLLYPHAWVRLSAGRLIHHLITNLGKFKKQFDDYEIQTIAHRILHQLSAPSISESLSATAIKILVTIAKKWSENGTMYINKNDLTSSERTTEYIDALDYLVSRASSIIRSEENHNESFMSKKSCIQLLAMLLQIVNVSQLESLAEKIILALYINTEGSTYTRLSEDQETLQNLANECMQMLESKLSVSSFTSAYSSAKYTISMRRQERRTKRSILAVTAPDVAANRKLKRHTRSREKRKFVKDDNGYYQQRNKQRKT